MKVEISKTYNPKEAEGRWYAWWESQGYFHADEKSKRPAFVIVMPPPNVTGSLHMGHMLNDTVQDVIVRRKRMLGFNTLWLPGMDHAGIGTQNVVEKELKKEGLTRHDLGREKFIERVWQWKEQYGGIILKQIRRIGASCDWSRERFTFDEGLSSAVREVPIIEDMLVDPAFGTGAVKVTPAHDPADFEMGQRHNLAQISVINEDAKITAEGGPYQGLDRSEARKRVVADLEAQGLLSRTESLLHNVGHCQRCSTVVEPLLSTQWFVKIKPLAEPALAAVEDGRTQFVPPNYAKTYFEWMRNMRDWWISRQ